MAFVDTNVAGTLTLLEEAVRASVTALVFTSRTSVFGRAMHSGQGEPAIWVTEELVPKPRNIYGATKTAAEDLCELVHREHGLPVMVLRTSRFFPESDDVLDTRTAYADDNVKANEYLYRRVDLQDVVEAHLCAVEGASATTLALALSSDGHRGTTIERCWTVSTRNEDFRSPLARVVGTKGYTGANFYPQTRNC